MSDVLLEGPRGRRLCLEYAQNDPAIATLIGFYAFHHAEEGSTHVVFATDGGETRVPDPSIADIAHLLGAASVDRLDEKIVAAALRASVDVAMYCQEPDGSDCLARVPEIREALRPVARALHARYGPEWAGERGREQWAVHWPHGGTDGGLPVGAAERLTAWDTELRDEERRARSDRPQDVTARVSGTWWSIPLSVLQTRGTIAAALDLVEDSFGPEAATIVPVRGSGRTLEIRGTAEWAELCRRYPVEVTASRRHDWYRTTGRDGRWLLPDWSRVGEEWDAVHLTTLGYLTAATRAIDVDEEYASLIAGWAPDSTLWLRDAAVEHGPRREYTREHPGAEWVVG